MHGENLKLFCGSTLFTKQWIFVSYTSV